jgi:hypothetical protein
MCFYETRAELMNGAMESIGRCAELVIEYCKGKFQIPVYFCTVYYSITRFQRTQPRLRILTK